MRMTMRKRLMLAVVGAVSGLGGTALAAEVEVRMLNKGAAGTMVFEPALVTIAPGDSVKFVATDKSHNAETIKGMIPDSAKPFAGKMSEDVTVAFDEAGVYGVKCMPHYGMGMVALIVVGKPANEEAARAVTHAGKAKTVFAALFEKLAAARTAAK
jgi:pseudoazurin